MTTRGEGLKDKITRRGGLWNQVGNSLALSHGNSNNKTPREYFFFLINKEEYVLKKGAKRATQDIQDSYTYPQPNSSNKKNATKKEVAPQPHPQREPTQLMKLTSIEGPSFINILVSDQRKKTNEAFSHGIESTSSKEILFLTF